MHVIKKIGAGLCLCLLGATSSLKATDTPYTWEATTPGSNLAVAGNWSPSGGPPVSTDDAIFDSTITDIDTRPVTSTNFDVLTLTFANEASPFDLTFTNCTLTITGSGIVGTTGNTDTTINITNTNTSIGTQLTFGTGSADSSCGSATIGISNIGTNANSEISNYQLLIPSSHTLNASDNASITFLNQGTCSGSSSSLGSAVLTGGQFKGGFSADDGVFLSVTNSGSDSSTGSGSNSTGAIVLDQFTLTNGFSVGDDASISFLNSGIITGSSHNNTAGQIVSGNQFSGSYPGFSAGNNLSFGITNSGSSSSTNSNGNSAGTLGTSQFVTAGAFTVLDNAQITIINSGTDTSPGANCSIGTLGGNQFYCDNCNFTTGNNLILGITNLGVKNGSGNGNNIATLTGIILAGNQFQCDQTFSTLDNSSVTILNSGTNSGTGFNNSVGLTDDNQFYSFNVSAGNNFSMNVSNIGINSSGASATGNSIGIILGSQVVVDGLFSVQNNASITISNTGISSAVETDNSAGLVGSGAQFAIYGPFSAGTGLTLSATNTATNTGAAGASVGVVMGSQLYFEGTFSVGDGAVVTATNSGGTITDTQIVFLNGFNILNGGSATFQAINSGTVEAPYNILVQGNNNGGNANIVLQNAGLYIDTNSATTPFTIASLNSTDTASFAQSYPPLNINTPASVSASFAGGINDFPSTTSTLIKSGLGAQTLSGTNLLTGSTTVQQGTLILTGSVGGDVIVTALNGLGGVLKGTGTVGGNLLVDDGGTVMPGQSIGTLNVTLDYTQETGGIYLTQVNGAGQSSQLNIALTASLDGTLQVVSTDGTYAIGVPYLILQAGEGIVSETTFQDVILDPLLAYTLTYDPTQVFLTLQTDFASAAVTGNERHVATAIDSIPVPTGDEIVVIDALLSLDPAAIPYALDEMAGTQYTFFPGIVQYSDRRFGRRIFDAVRDALDPCICTSSCGNFEGWISIESGGICAQGNEESCGMHAPLFDISLGAYAPITDSLLVGAALNFDETWMHFHQGGHTNLNTFQGAIYATWQDPCFYAFSDLVFGGSRAHFDRPIIFADIDRTAHSVPEFLHGVWYGECGMNFTFCNSLVQPFIGVDVNYVYRKAISENSAESLDLHIDSKTLVQYHTYLGAHFRLDLMKCCTLNADIAWQHRFGSSGTIQTTRFEEFGDSFSIAGPCVSNDGIWGSLNLMATVYHGLDLYVEWSGEYWDRWGACSGSLGAIYRF